MNDDPEELAATDRALDYLDGRADKWAADVNLVGMVEFIVSPMNLNPNVPTDIRASFMKRMRE